MSITTLYTRLTSEDGPGNLVARQAVAVRAALDAGRITFDEAAITIEDLTRYPYAREGRTPDQEREFMGEHPELVKARINDPDFQRWSEWYASNMNRLRATTEAILSDDEGLIDRVWKERDADE